MMRRHHSKRPLFICFLVWLLCLCLWIRHTNAFVIRYTFDGGTIARSNIVRVLAKSSEENDAAESSLPQLPALGASSFDPPSLPLNKYREENEENSGPKRSPILGDKFELQYTCKICDTRNSNRVSRIAYRTGVVIAICKGCMSKHLVADNLGWSNYIGGFEGDKNIEEYMANRGLEDSVKRVSKDVFELEKVLGASSESGSIVGNRGEPTME